MEERARVRAAVAWRDGRNGAAFRGAGQQKEAGLQEDFAMMGFVGRRCWLLGKGEASSSGAGGARALQLSRRGAREVTRVHCLDDVNRRCSCVWLRRRRSFCDAPAQASLILSFFAMYSLQESCENFGKLARRGRRARALGCGWMRNGVARRDADS